MTLQATSKDIDDDMDKNIIMFLLKPQLMLIDNTNVTIIFMYNMQYFLNGHRCTNWGPLECVLATRYGH